MVGTASAVVAPPVVGESYRLRGGATCAERPDGALVLRHDRMELTMRRSGAGRRAVVRRLAAGWAGDDEVNETVAAVEGEGAILHIQLLLRRLVAHGWLDRRLAVADRPLLVVCRRGVGSPGPDRPARHEPGVRYRLSRFATLRSGDDGLVATTPRSTTTVGLPDARIAQALALAAGTGCDRDGLADAAGVPDAAAGQLLDVLVGAGILVGPADRAAERGCPPYAFWSPDELAVHDRSRAGRHGLPIGGTYRFRDAFGPEPLRRDPDGSALALPVPDLAARRSTDPPLERVVGERRSVRRHDDAAPITLTQLGEFLYRVGRTWDVREAGGQQVGRRPYPAGGQTCELELYPLVRRCAGAEAGLYHYDSLAHRLVPVAAWGEPADRMLGYARAAATMDGDPQVLLVCAARVSRLMWKYEGLGYPMVLRNAGVLTGLMYLVATAMRLAPCAVGSGDSAAFAALAGLDPLEEPSVADFLLGSLPADDRDGDRP